MVHAAALAPNARGQEKGARAVTPRRYRDPGSRVRCSSHRAGVLSLNIPGGPPPRRSRVRADHRKPVFRPKVGPRPGRVADHAPR